MLIYLLRHGLTEYNAQKRYQGQRDIPLSPEGLAQLRRADIDPKVVYISTLPTMTRPVFLLFTLTTTSSVLPSEIRPAFTVHDFMGSVSCMRFFMLAFLSRMICRCAIMRST